MTSYAIAMGIGNTSVRLGVAHTPEMAAIEPKWLLTATLPTQQLDLDKLHDLPQPGSCSWNIASVCRPVEAAVVEWIQQTRHEPIRSLTHRELPIRVNVEFPERVGLDRLVAAVAAVRIRETERPAIVVDVGTAITVNWIDRAGDFQGGAILPSPYLAARALAEGTDQLPSVEFLSSGIRPEPLGKNTEHAIQSGLFWGAVGAVRELVEKFSAHSPALPTVFITGGRADAMADCFPFPVVHVPDLVLRGILWGAHGVR